MAVPRAFAGTIPTSTTYIFIYGEWSGVSDGHPDELAERQRQLMCNGEFAVAPTYTQDPAQHMFRYAPADSEEDARRGRICTKCRKWVPGRHIQLYLGLTYCPRCVPSWKKRPEELI